MWVSDIVASGHEGASMPRSRLLKKEDITGACEERVVKGVVVAERLERQALSDMGSWGGFPEFISFR